MLEKLTPVEEKIYAYIAGYITDNGYCPTSQEIALSVGSTTQSVDAHSKNIIKKGWLKFNMKKHRKYELVPKK